MKRYHTYKDSGVEWIGEMPEGWEVKKLKYCFSFHTGWTPPTTNSDYFIGDNIWITIADMKAKYLNDSVQKLSDEALNELRIKITKKGSLLYSFKLSVGKIAFAEKDLYTNEAILSISPMEKYDLQYYYYALPECLIINANENIYGAKILNQDLIRNSFLIVPPKPVQKSVAVYLDSKTAQIDKLISKKHKLIELRKEERAAIINQAVTKGLNSDAPMKDSGIEWLPKIPKDWQTTSVKYITSSGNNAIVDGPFGSSVNVQTDYVNNGIPVVRTVNITDNGFDPTNLKFMRKEKFEQLKRHAVYPKDILLSKVGTIGNACLFPEYLKEGILSTTGSCKITVNIKMAIPEYVVFLLQSMKDYLNFLANANVQSFLNMMTIKNIRIPLPKISEQLKIIEYVLIKTSKFDQTTSKIEKQIDLLKEFRTALISEVVTGKIDIRDKELK